MPRARLTNYRRPDERRSTNNHLSRTAYGWGPLPSTALSMGTLDRATACFSSNPAPTEAARAIEKHSRVCDPALSLPSLLVCRFIARRGRAAATSGPLSLHHVTSRWVPALFFRELSTRGRSPAEELIAGVKDSFCVRVRQLISVSSVGGSRLVVMLERRPNADIRGATTCDLTDTQFHLSRRQIVTDNAAVRID